MTEAWKTWEGQTVDGFPLRKYLGGSDHSAVYLTQVSAGAQDAAIKFVPADGDADAQIARWRAAGQLSYPHLQQLIRVGRCRLSESNFLYVVMEHAEEDLSQILPQRALEPDEVRPVLQAAVDALTYLQGQGLAHTMLKPSNILAAGDQLKISSDTVSEIGSRPAAPEASIYVAPESSNAPIATAGDVWSLGVTLVEMLTQRTPAIHQSHVDLPEQGMPAPFLEIARRSLELDPARRASLQQISGLLNPSAVAASSASIGAASIPAEPAATMAAKVPTGTTAREFLPVTASPASSSPSFSTIDSPVAIPQPEVPKKSLTSQHATLIPRTLTAASAGTASMQIAHRARKSRYTIPALAALLVVGAILAAPRMMNRFSQLQPQAAVEPSIVPAPSTLQNHIVTTRKERFNGGSSKPDSQFADASRNSSTEKNHSGKTSPGFADTNARDRFDSNGRDLSASTREVAHRDAVANTPPAKTAKTDQAPNTEKGSVLFQVVPDISQRARDTIHGKVKVSVKLHVDPSGTVVGKTIENDGSSRFFAEQAIQVADRWTFNPPEKEGRAVPSEWLLRFEFSPQDTKVFPTQTNP
jgi:TonB family protein